MNLVAERRFFKLPTGYLHVDDHGLAFTRSGNWEEADKAAERSRRLRAGHLVRVVLGVALIGTGMVFYAMKGLHGGGGTGFTIAAVGAAFGIYKLINRLQDDMAQTFRIPFAKVRSMATAEGRLVVSFVNGAWKEDEARAELPGPDAAWVKAAWESQRG